LIFCSGGLGPTSDDITRDSLAAFVGQPLELHQESWQTIQNKLQGRKVTLRDGHRQQAMLPKSAKALDNDAGVAPGFYLESGSKKFWVLPGPPKEISAIWEKHVAVMLTAFADHAMVLQTWRFTGVPESELAFMTEQYFGPFEFKKKFGYRAHAPYVEIKLWHDNSAEAQRAINGFAAMADKYLKSR